MKKYLGLLVLVLLSALSGCTNSKYIKEEKGDSYNMDKFYIEIDDEVIDSADPMKITIPLHCILLGVYERDEYENIIKQFTKEQLNVYYILSYDAEVNSGGHYSYFSWETGDRCKETLEALKEIGLENRYKTLENAIQCFDMKALKSAEGREKFMDENELDFEDHDDEYYGFYGNDQKHLNDYLMEYINANRSKFYFEGYIPESDFFFMIMGEYGERFRDITED